MKTHHTTRKNKMVHTVASPHSRKFSVTRRVPTLSGGPEWTVYESDSGPGAEVVAHFFSETDARDYAKWREIQRNERRRMKTKLTKWEKPSPVTKDFRCGDCGKPVKPYKCSLKCDGWHWHKECWRKFLTE